MSQNIGKISQIIGPVIDIIFENSNNELPKIYDALEIIKNDPMITNEIVEWKLSEWVDVNRRK